MTMRRGYYQSPAPKPAHRASGKSSAYQARNTQEAEEPVEPVIGAAAIAARLKIKKSQLYRILSPDRRRVAESTEPQMQPPIRKLPGLGLAADGPTLDAWWRAVLRGRNE